MNAITTTMPSLTARSLTQTMAVYRKEAKYEFLKNIRLRMYSFAAIVFPLMFYVLFGLVMNNQSIAGVRTTEYLIASYGTFAVMGASLYGIGGGMAVERGLGWMQVKRASPMPPFAYFTAKFAVSMLFGLITVLLLLLLGFTFGGVRLPLNEIVKMVAILVAGSLPFCAMGLAIGYFVGPNSAPAVINIFYLPFSFCSGLWVPFIFLPKVVRTIAHFLPPYHLAQLALGVVGAGQQESSRTHWEALIGFTLLCLGIARIGYQRDEKMYG